MNALKLSSGRNSSLIDGQTKSEHAEENGMNNLHRLNMHRRFLKLGEKIDILVVRLSKTGVLGFSRPCRNCLVRLAKSPYPISRIYYSVDPDTIRYEKFKSMFDSHMTRLSSGDRIKKMKKALYVGSNSFNSSNLSGSDSGRSRSNSPKCKSKRRHKNSRKN